MGPCCESEYYGPLLMREKVGTVILCPGPSMQDSGEDGDRHGRVRVTVEPYDHTAHRWAQCA